jgi:DnaD/phage-associated family protein
MAEFPGFPAGKVRFTKIPAPFYTDLLPQIDHLVELKVTLYALWQLDRMEGQPRYLQYLDFSEDKIFMDGLAKDDKKSHAALKDGLKRAVERHTLLKLEIELDGQERDFFFLNSARGRAAAEEIEKGEWQPSGDSRFPIELMQEKPNIFALYENHIGPLTPMIADTLKEAEEEYPQRWIEESIRIAVENNARKWSYVQAILLRWKEEGRDERRHQGDSEKDRRKYVGGKFSDFIEH